MSNRLGIEFNNSKLSCVLDELIDLHDKVFQAREAVEECLSYLSRCIECNEYEAFEREIYNKYLNWTSPDEVNAQLQLIK